MLIIFIFLSFMSLFQIIHVRSIVGFDNIY